MRRARIKWDKRNKVQLMPEVKAELRKHGNRIAEACGPGFTAEDADTATARARVWVKPETVDAAILNERENTILRNTNAGTS